MRKSATTTASAREAGLPFAARRDPIDKETDQADREETVHQGLIQIIV
jgi:hypothetical protein